MVQMLMRDSRPVGCASEDSSISMGDNESALILIRHCNDMKQQEARLRLITLLVLLVSMVLVLFTSHLQPWYQGNLASSQKTVSCPVLLWSLISKKLNCIDPLYKHGRIKML